MNIILAVSCVIVALCGLRGYQKGALQMVYGIASWIFVAVLLLFGTSHVETYLINETPVYDRVNQQVTAYLSEQWDDVQNEIITGMREQGTSYVLEVPEYLSANKSVTAAVSAIYENLKVSLQSVAESDEFAWRESVDASISEVKDKTISTMAFSITGQVLHVIAIAIIMASSAVLLLVVRWAIVSLSGKKGIKTFNKGAGLAVGLFAGVIVLQVIFGVLHMVDFTEWGSLLVNEIETTPLLQFVDQLNIFKIILS